MPVRFVLGGTDMKVQNPELTNREKVRKFLTSQRAAGGQLYVYDKGITTYELKMRWRSLRDSEKEELQAFFDDDADGMVNTFTFYDQRKVQYTARFLHSTIEFVELADSLDSGETFTSDGNTYPTTVRTTPAYWATEITMEVVAV